MGRDNHALHGVATQRRQHGKNEPGAATTPVSCVGGGVQELCSLTSDGNGPVKVNLVSSNRRRILTSIAMAIRAAALIQSKAVDAPGS